MPFRALMWTVLTVALALAAVAMWVRAVEPMVMAAQEAAKLPGVYPATQAGGATRPILQPSPPVEQRVLVKGMLVLSFVLICSLLVVGFLGAFREWVRYRSGADGTREKVAKTKYVDAWKIAGERLKEPGPPENEHDAP